METSRQSSSLFVRQSSGLVREASALDAMIFNAVFSAPVGATLAFGIFYALGTSPGADIVLALLIACIVNIPVRIYTQYEPVLMVTGALTRSNNHETVYHNRET
jgi:basic amino acid/polyamine antiporter, APA family